MNVVSFQVQNGQFVLNFAGLYTPVDLHKSICYFNALPYHVHKQVASRTWMCKAAQQVGMQGVCMWSRCGRRSIDVTYR